jgi:hypothetical protein
MTTAEDLVFQPCSRCGGTGVYCSGTCFLCRGARGRYVPAAKVAASRKAAAKRAVARKKAAWSGQESWTVADFVMSSATLIVAGRASAPRDETGWAERYVAGETTEVPASTLAWATDVYTAKEKALAL